MERSEQRESQTPSALWNELPEHRWTVEGEDIDRAGVQLQGRSVVDGLEKSATLSGAFKSSGALSPYRETASGGADLTS